MRAAYQEWYEANANELTRLWDDGLIVFDASALLGLYRADRASSRSVLELMDWLGDRAWIPYTAGLEFHRNRLQVLSDQARTYGDIRDRLSSVADHVKVQVARHAVLRSNEFNDEVKRKMTELSGLVTQLEEQHAWRSPGELEDDAVLSSLDQLFGNNIGDPIEVTAERREEAMTRLESKTPPGFRDHVDPEVIPGDLLIWWETLAKIREGGPGGNGVLLVTEDFKDDWWRLHDGKRVGPRPELTKEAMKAGTKVFWMHSLAAFVRSGSLHLGWESSGFEVAHARLGSGSTDPGGRDSHGGDGEKSSDDVSDGLTDRQPESFGSDEEIGPSLNGN
jgi:hypothetical protein